MTWLPKPPASELALRRLARAAGLELPTSYLEHLASCNGGEGDLAMEPGWIQIWPAEEVLGLNRQYEVPSALPGFFGIGSNGGGELIALDTRAGTPFPVVMVPFVPMDAGEARRVAESFDDLRSMVGRSEGGSR